MNLYEEIGKIKTAGYNEHLARSKDNILTVSLHCGILMADQTGGVFLEWLPNCLRKVVILWHKLL